MMNESIHIKTKRNISAEELYSTKCVEWAVDHFGIGLIHF